MDQARRERCVLLVSDIPFEGEYIARVLRERTVDVIGPLSDPADALAAVAAGGVCATVVGVHYTLHRHGDLLRAAQDRDMPLLLLTGQSISNHPLPDATVLTRPFAAFQVADWVARASGATPALS